MAESTSPKKTKTKTTVLSINQRLEQIEKSLNEIKNQIEVIDRDFSKE